MRCNVRRMVGGGGGVLSVFVSVSHVGALHAMVPQGRVMVAHLDAKSLVDQGEFTQSA